MVRSVSASEHDRLSELERYQLVGTAAEEDFDRIVNLTGRVFEAPLACVSLVAEDHIWFKSTFGFCADQIPRQGAFCAHTVDMAKPLVVNDARSDPIFANNPLVTGEMGVRFYAGIPVLSSEGYAIGTLCILDRKPRDVFHSEQLEMLNDLTTMIMDRIELRYARLQQRDTEKRFQQVTLSLGEGIACADREGRITFWNPGAESIFGYSQREIVGQPMNVLFHNDDPETQASIAATLSDEQLDSPGGALIELEGLHKRGHRFALEACISRWKDHNGQHFSAILRNISARKAREEKIRFLAEHDPLTGLANRDQFRRTLRNLTGGKDGYDTALFLIDLDGFKEINDAQGHAFGDRVLCEVANRLRALEGDIELIARLGGDEFAVLLGCQGERERAQDFAEDIVNAIKAEPFISNGQSCYLDCSIGITFCPEEGQSVDALFANADLSLYRAKAASGSEYVFYQRKFRESLESRRALQHEIDRAVKRDEFELYYQPQIDIDENCVVGAEALIRWNHPERGVLTPYEFLETMNSGVHAEDMANWVLRTACQQGAAWYAANQNIRIGVNLIPSQLRADDFADTVARTLYETGLPPHLLELEVTENMLLERNKRLIKRLNRIRELGVSIAFDDFGTGYASLSHLKDFPLDRIKIDRGFIRGICNSAEDSSIVLTIIRLGQLLGLQVTAEGIEDPEQLKILKNHKGCEAQGFYFGRPMRASKFSDYLDTHSRRDRAAA